MKVIFLDIDGVVQSPRYCVAIGGRETDETFEPAAMMLLSKLVKETKAKIVISSDWRLDGPEEQAKHGLRQAFKIAGFPEIAYAFHTDWQTPFLKEASRGQEIARWLSRHHEVTRYVILDDIDAMLDEQKSAFVQTDPLNGFLLGHYIAARQILNKDDFDGNE